jgi:hypothetical protein
MPSGPPTGRNIIIIQINTKHPSYQPLTSVTHNFGGSPGGAFNHVNTQTLTDPDGQLILQYLYWLEFTGAVGDQIDIVFGTLIDFIAASAVCYECGSDGYIAEENIGLNYGLTSSVPCALLTTPARTDGISIAVDWYRGTTTNAATASWALSASMAPDSPQKAVAQQRMTVAGTNGASSLALTDPTSKWMTQWMMFAHYVPPIITSDPSITGTPTVGVASAFTPSTASSGSITSSTWYVDGAPVGTAATYTPVIGDAGKTLVITQVWTNADGSTSASSPGKVIGSTPVATVGSAAWFNYLQGAGSI